MKIHNKAVDVSSIALGLILAFLSVQSVAEEKVDIGKREYDSACAVCHGISGKGDDGPLKAMLVKPVPNLTVLAQNNKGVFPFDKVYQIIDGREELKSHGPRDMPVWGNAFNNQSSLYFDNYPQQDSESAARSRILALVEYLYRLQQ